MFNNITKHSLKSWNVLAICLAISTPNYPIYFIPLVGAFIILVINEKDFK